MSNDISYEQQKESIRKYLLKYTVKAFRMLPEMDRPRILDLSCGTGIPTLELARLSGGDVLGIDIDRYALEKLDRKIEEVGLGHRVRTKECSITDMDLPDGHFDIIWSEGSIFVLGFGNGLVRFSGLLKEKGYLVVHDESGDIPEKIRQISDSGYDLLGHFELSRDVWWDEYFKPLKKVINGLRPASKDDPGLAAELAKDQRDIEMFLEDPTRFCSVYFVMRKR